MSVGTQQIIRVFQRALEHHQAERLEQASILYRKILDKVPTHAGSMNMLGVIALEDGKHREAISYIHNAIRINPQVPSFYNNLGSALLAEGEVKAAEQAFKNAIILKSSYAGAKYNLANLYIEHHREADGYNLYQEIIAESPTFIDVYRGCSQLLMQREQWFEAEKLLRLAAKKAPQDADIFFRLAEVMRVQGRNEPALVSYRRCLELDGFHINALYQLGDLLRTIGEYDEAVDYLRLALQREPLFAEAQFSLSQCLEGLNRLVDAEEAYRRTLALDPKIPALTHLHLAMVRRKVCDWSGDVDEVEQLIQQTEKHIRTNHVVPLPVFYLDLFPVQDKLRFAVARHHARTVERKVAPLKTRNAFEHTRVRSGRLKVGYVSTGFNEQGIGPIVHGLFRQHDRSAFEVYAYNLAPHKDSYTERVRRSVDHFIDSANMAPEALARRINEDGVHILIDMSGYSAFAKPEVFAMRPSPVQAHYFGYLGTMGASFLPYVIVDQHAAPEDVVKSWREACVYLPETMVAATQLKVSAKPFSREKAGLDPDTFVYCCFNDSQKIDPTVFECWMRILKQVPDSMLWLYDQGITRPKMHLHKVMRSHGIDTGRVRYGKQLPLDEHLARFRAADLYLDTFVRNARTMAIGALYTGLPVLTMTGQTFQSRIGTSLVEAAGAPELICTNENQYIEKAVWYARNRDELKSLRRRMVQDRDKQPLFNTNYFVSHLEEAYRKMWEQYESGIRPTTIRIEPKSKLARAS